MAAAWIHIMAVVSPLSTDRLSMLKTILKRLSSTMHASRLTEML